MRDQEKTVDDMQWDLAAKYLAGEGSGEERRRFEQWVAEDPQRGSVLDSLRPYFASRPTASASVDVDAAWAAMAARIEQDKLGVEADRTGRSQGQNTRWRRWGMAAAATLLIVTGASLLLVPNLPDSGRLTVATGPGEKRDIALADGSRIVVAPLSRVEMLGDRRAKLLGEAYFVIAHDPSRPFRVETADATVQDLGTSFVVRAGSARQPTFVAVEEGVVSLAPATSPTGAEALVLREGESGTMSSAGPVRGDSATWSRGMAWTRGEIVFDDLPLPEVARELNRWFGITVQLADPSLESRSLTARLSDESVDEIIEAIARSLGVKHTRAGDSVVFRP